MRSDRDKRTDSEREIDEFLAQFETPVDELSADINSYLETSDTTKLTAAHTFYGAKVSELAGSNEEAAEFSDASSEDNTLPSEAVVTDAHADTSVSPADDQAAVSPVPSDDKGPEQAEKTEKKKKKSRRKKSPVESKAKAELQAAGAKISEGADKVASKVKNIKAEDVKRELFLKKNPNFDPDKTVSGSNKQYVFSIGKLFRDFVLLGVIMVFCFMLYALGCITLAPHIDPKDIYSAVDTSSMIYDDEGKEIDSVFYTQNRQVVKYDQMPENLINSFIAIEDKTFWKHHGFNWTRMFGAILSSFGGGGRISGTSTITQQLARNVYLSDIKSVRSIRRKIVEMHYASKIERALTKEQIIEAYLNSIYLGYGCYGVDAAARTYFSKEVKDLDLLECAALAALPQAPEDYALLKIVDGNYQAGKDAKIVQKEPDTIVTNDAARARRDLTLKLMKDQGFIDDSQYSAAVDKSLNTFINPTISSGNGNYSYYHEYLVDTIIRDLMDKYGMEYSDAERTVYTKGLKIYSTMDSQAQNVIAEEFKDSSNFPEISAINRTDENGNMLNNEDEIALYNYNNYFDENGNFTISGDAVNINSDGSVTIMKDHDLNIYETQVADGVDYSLEFKNYYVVIDNQVYSIQGGFINIPPNYKSLDGSGNLVISADYFTDYDGYIIKGDDTLTITDEAYSLATKTLQPQGAMVIVGVGTGEVKAMVGGRTFRGQKLLNRALNARQPGSSIKPLAVYGAALQKSFDLQAEDKKWPYIDFGIDKQGIKGWGDYVTVHTTIEDEKTHIENRDWPENVTRTFSGANTFKTAIQKSINTCAVKLQLQVGSDYSMDMLEKFGITTAIRDESQYANDMNPAALALGAMVQGVEPVEMALAYAAFPGGGKLNTPICYTKVLDRNGEVLLESKSTQSEVINEGVAFIMTDVLQSVVKANGYTINEVKTGGKTGTTDDRYDVWFDGFTPSYAASLWIGTDQNVEMSDLSWVAAKLWGKIIGQIPKACTGTYPAQPENVISLGGNYYTKGTETGLAVYKSPERIKKEREEALRKKRAQWDREREKHKVLIPEKGHYENKTVHHDAVTHTEEDKSKPIYGSKTVVDKAAWEETVTDPDTGETKVIKHPAETHEEQVITGYEKRTVVDKEAWDETVQVWVVDKPAHYEYEKGWRKGDRP